MKSFKMKALALATLGLGGLVMAGSAFAACPDPTAFSNQGYATPNGPWTVETVTSATIASGAGLAGTSCAMYVAFTQSAGVVPGNAGAFVSDSSPQNEPRYRARFYVDLTNVSSQFKADGSQDQVLLMNAVASASPNGISSNMVRISLLGGNPMQLRMQVADAGLGSKFKILLATLPNQTGPNRIEFDYNTGTSSACASGNSNGSFCYWLNNASDASGSDSAPTAHYNLAANSFDASGNTGWSGVFLANLGISSPSYALQTSSAGTQSLAFDEFDSRRQTFIGQ